MIKVINNFLTKTYHKEILNLLNSENFPWYMFKNISDNKDNNSIYSVGFSNSFFKDGKLENNSYSAFLAPFVYQVMDAVGGSEILRSRADMTLAAPNNFIHDSHVDYEESNISTIFYVNDSDGDTILYDDNFKERHRESPVANKLFIFEGHRPHTGSSPSKNKNRILINSNFI